MRLKSLRKERPTFESEGAVINGNRIDLSKGDLKLTKHRSNTSFAFPSSLSIESSSIFAPLSDRTNDMSTRSRQQAVFSNIIQPEQLPEYQAIEAAYLERGIRIRLSPSRTSQATGKKSGPSGGLQRHTAFASRNPSRTSSVLQYTSNDIEQSHDSRPFSVLQQSSSDDFGQSHGHNVSYAQSSQLNDESHYHDYIAQSIVASEHFNPTPITPVPIKVPPMNDILSTTVTSFDNDPDFLYMSTLLTKSSGDAFRDTIRRRAGLRGTFSTYRSSLTASFIQPQSRDKSPQINRASATRINTFTVLPPPSTQKIDKDIIKHASRIRRMSQSKDLLSKYSGTDLNATTDTSPPRTDTRKYSSNNKSSKSLSLKPLEFLLSSVSRSASLSANDLSSIKTPTNSRKSKTSIKRSSSAKHLINVEENPTDSIIKENITSSNTSHDERLALMRTSPLDVVHQTNSFDSGYYDHSSSGGDAQSLTSSSVMQHVSSTPSVRIASSPARRSNSIKRVSFYEEPTAFVATTTTYV